MPGRIGDVLTQKVESHYSEASILVSGFFEGQHRYELGELGKRGLEVVDDLRCQNCGRWKIGSVVERLVPEPRDVEVRLVPGDDLVIAVAVEPLRLDALRTVIGSVGRDEFLQVRRAKRVRRKPFSPRPDMAPRKSRTVPTVTEPLYLLHWK